MRTFHEDFNFSSMLKALFLIVPVNKLPAKQSDVFLLLRYFIFFTFSSDTI